MRMDRLLKTFHVQTGSGFEMSRYARETDKSRNFADNIGINFKTPEEFFLNETPRPFTRTFDPFGYITEAEGMS